MYNGLKNLARAVCFIAAAGLTGVVSTGCEALSPAAERYTQLEGTVFDENYTPASSGGCEHRIKSQYSFSMDTGETGRIAIQVLDSQDYYNPTRKETIDGLISRGTKVKVQIPRGSSDMNVITVRADAIMWD